MVEKPQSKKQNTLERQQQAPSYRYEREIADSFPRLWEWWRKEIAKTYAKHSDKTAVKDIFSIAKKYNRKEVPQSMVATALLDYADGVHGGQLSSSDFETYLQAQWEEYQKLKVLEKEFNAQKDDADFAAYQTYITKANKKQPVTIAQIRETKGYSTSTLVFSQYLEKSFATAENKEAILQKLSTQSQTAFVEYTQSNKRLASIVQLPATFTDRLTTKTEQRETISSENKKSFSDASDVFDRDIVREDGPKKMLEGVDSTVFWETWLSKQDIESFRSTLKDISLASWTFFLARYPGWELPSWVTAEVMKKYVDDGDIPKDISQETLDSCFEQIVMAYFVVESKKRMEIYVLKSYFGQVADLLQVWGTHIHLLTEQQIDYQKDGSIRMKYQTTEKLQGDIVIDANGVVHIDTLLGYDQQEGAHFNIQPMRKTLAWWLPSMVTMLQRASMQKEVFYADWKKQLIAGWEQWDNNTVDTGRVVRSEQNQEELQAELAATVLTDRDEMARKNLEIPMKKELVLMQCVDRITRFAKDIAEKQGIDPKNDVWLQYIQKARLDDWVLKESLVQKDTPLLKPLFAIRAKIMNWSLQQAEDIVSWLDSIQKVFSSVAIQKEQYPFVVDGWEKVDREEADVVKQTKGGSLNWISVTGSEQQESTSLSPRAGKKTLRSFLSFFCMDNQAVVDFNLPLFSKAVITLQHQKNDIGALHRLSPTAYDVPLQSLYYQNNPELAKQTMEVMQSTGAELAALQSQVVDQELLRGLG